MPKDTQENTLPIAVEGKVKALEWKPVALIDGWNWMTVAQADTPFGRYTLDKHTEGFLRVMFSSQRIGHFEVGEEGAAKTAAQTDYETRVLSALTYSPGKDGGQEVEAVEWQGRYWIEDEGRWSNWITNPVGYRWAHEPQEGKSEIRYLYPQPASTALVERLTTSADEIWIEPNPPADPIRGQDWSETNAWGQQATKYVRADIAETLLKVLEPFAKEADKFDPIENDDHFLTWGTTFTIGDLRRARSALSSSTSREGER